MTPGDREGLPLEAEPIEWLHPALVGTASPGLAALAWVLRRRRERR